MGILAAVFLASVLLYRYAMPPESWRRVDASMTLEELHVKLGKTHLERVNEMRWREKRLLGDWELTVQLNGESVKKFQKHFRLFNKAEFSRSD